MTIIGHLPWLNAGNSAQPLVCSMKGEWQVNRSTKADEVTRLNRRQDVTGSSGSFQIP
jgi:hypothetical protein